MFFKSVSSLEDVFSFANKVVETCYENKLEYLKGINLYSIPSIRTNNKESDNYWLYSIFNFRFVYWKEYNLLGLVGYEYPKEVETLFDTHISFQNSCSTDYPYETWSKLECTREFIDSIRGMSATEFADILISDEDDYYTEADREDILSNADYHKKMYVYDKIFESILDLDTWLGDGDSDKFMRFALNGLTTSERYYDALHCLNKVNCDAVRYLKKKIHSRLLSSIEYYKM